MLQSAPRVEEITALQASLTATSSGTEELEKKLSDKETVIKEKERHVEQLKEALQEQVSLLQTKEVLLTELQKNIADRTSSLEETKGQLKTTESELHSLKEQVARVSTHMYFFFNHLS